MDFNFGENDDLDALLDLDAPEPKIRVKPEPSPEPSLRIPPSIIPGPVLPSLLPDEPSVKPEPAGDDLVPAWGSALQLHTFRQNAENIAVNYLKDQKIKLGKGRKRNEHKHVPDAYNRGLEDGKKVDLKRRKIED